MNFQSNSMVLSLGEYAGKYSMLTFRFFHRSCASSISSVWWYGALSITITSGSRLLRQRSISSTAAIMQRSSMLFSNTVEWNVCLVETWLKKPITFRRWRCESASMRSGSSLCCHAYCWICPKANPAASANMSSSFPACSCAWRSAKRRWALWYSRSSGALPGRFLIRLKLNPCAFKRRWSVRWLTTILFFSVILLVHDVDYAVFSWRCEESVCLPSYWSWADDLYAPHRRDHRRRALPSE